jgi:hypothetical protein
MNIKSNGDEGVDLGDEGGRMKVWSKKKKRLS